ncbi:MAG: beta-N-acetylhexosaminidase [Alphaproteobacteria bacterium]|nr:beta-N-acetylhexosaminidase [Alphaproteobacteria bacterium]
MRRFFLTAILALCSVVLGQANAHPALLPAPTSVQWRDGEFKIERTTIVEGAGDAGRVAEYLAHALKLKTAGLGPSRIRLLLIPGGQFGGPEGYSLRVAGSEIRIEAEDPRGLFYGVQTLRQLVSETVPGQRSVPAVEIRDGPRFKWRGLLIDVSRHFFGPPTLLRLIDVMAAYKLNVLHLHLTDYQGWRLEIPSYPRLTPTSSTGRHKTRQYYNAGDIKKIVAFAAERNIVIVPEIEMPGHAGAAAQAYPQFFGSDGIFDPAKPETYRFIRTVMATVSKLFPGPVIHFGGDEVPEETWDKMPDVVRFREANGLQARGAVQACFGNEVAKIIAGVGKRPMAWDEQAEAGVSKDVLIEWWRKSKPEVRDAAVKAGYEVVLSPADELYLDYAQRPGEPGAPWEGNDNGPTSVAKIIAWTPVPANYTDAEKAKVIGIEAAVWTEFIRSERYLQYMTFPRLLVVAEKAWAERDISDAAEFTDRLQKHIERLRKQGINARRSFDQDAVEFVTH